VGADVACCAISHAATARQSWVASTLGELSELTCGPAPLLLLIGRAMQSLLSSDEVKVEALALIDEAVELREEY
jgi:uroporphyrin-III C-methyltransferase